MAEKHQDLPDISGVFNIDESKIPTRVIEKKPDETVRRPAGEPVMLRGPVTREEKKAEKLEQQERRLRRKEAAKKRRRAKLIRIAALAGAVLIAALVLIGVIARAKRPAVTLAVAEKNTVASHYDTSATVVKDVNGDGGDRLYAVFVENNFDVYGLAKGMKAEMKNAEDRTVTGVVTDIRKEESDSSLIERIMQLLTDAVVETNANYTVVVLPDDPTAITEGETLQMRVITKEAKDVLTVPAGAVRRDGDQPYVWVYKSFGKKLVRRDVAVGLTADGLAEISKGLDAGQSVAVGWTCEETDLHDGIKVKIAQPGEQTETAPPVQTTEPVSQLMTTAAPTEAGQEQTTGAVG